MSREIKFRAWSKTLRKYRQLDETSNDQGLGMLFEVKKGIGSNVTSICHSVGDVVEQYTGLKDVNGDDIYEGDLLKIKYPFSDNDEICEVKWSNSDAGFIIGNFQFWKVVPKSVVVGNVHEDKDLLEADK